MFLRSAVCKSLLLFMKPKHILPKYFIGFDETYNKIVSHIIVNAYVIAANKRSICISNVSVHLRLVCADGTSLISSLNEEPDVKSFLIDRWFISVVDRIY